METRDVAAQREQALAMALCAWRNTQPRSPQRAGMRAALRVSCDYLAHKSRCIEKGITTSFAPTPYRIELRGDLYRLVRAKVRPQASPSPRARERRARTCTTRPRRPKARSPDEPSPPLAPRGHTVEALVWYRRLDGQDRDEQVTVPLMRSWLDDWAADGLVEQLADGTWRATTRTVRKFGEALSVRSAA